jgi:hypothetical protein
VAGSKSDYLEAAFLNLILGATPFTAPATLYVALSTAAYSDAATGSSMTEVASSSTNYARVAITNNVTNWPAATTGGVSGSPGATKLNGSAITYAAATAAWGTVTAFYLCDAPTGGNALYGGDLTTPKAIQQGDTATFGASTITITED